MHKKRKVTKKKRSKKNRRTRRIYGGIPNVVVPKSIFSLTSPPEEEDVKPPIEPPQVDKFLSLREKNKYIPIEDKEYNDYLGDVLFGEENEKDLKSWIMEKSFGSNTYFLDLFQDVMKVLPEPSKGIKWVDCAKDCFTECNESVMMEIGSTAYMLRVLTKSVVGDKENHKISFVLSLNSKEKLTGIWESDNKYFKMEILNLDKSRKICQGRLIMGFGPSASGKTYCANKVIELMSAIDYEFPKFFMTVDGGISREESIVYQTIIKAVKEKGEYDGLKNLVATSKLSSSIFESNVIKKKMKEYLKEQKAKNDFVVCLYVPETLGSCVRKVNCNTTYDDYVDITGDKDWIGLMIFQHKEHKECPYKEKYKCKGTTESGQSREITEGKKYSSKAWELSYKNGNYSIGKAETYRFRIHNSGRRDGITVFEDLSSERLNIGNKNISDFFTLNNWQYVNGKVKYNADCEIYSNECEKGRSRSGSESSVE